jgi:hypothetical protein
MSATLASNGSPTARRATMNKSQSQENNRLEDEKGPAHKVCPSTGESSLSLMDTLYPDSRLSCNTSISILPHTQHDLFDSKPDFRVHIRYPQIHYFASRLI